MAWLSGRLRRVRGKCVYPLASWVVCVRACVYACVRSVVGLEEIGCLVGWLVG